MAKELHILMADDDTDDQYFFDITLEKLSLSTKLTIVENGEKLMSYLLKNLKKLPEVIFLDMNMPRKNGAECLKEIKNNKVLAQIPVIIYSTSLNAETANSLYNTGAHYYIRKGNLKDLENTLQYIITLIIEDRFVKPPKDKFIFDLNTVQV